MFHRVISQEGTEAEVASEVLEQEVHQVATQRQFFGRSKLLSSAVGVAERAQAKGGMMVVEGGPGEGKTVFMVNFFFLVGIWNVSLTVCFILMPLYGHI